MKTKYLSKHVKGIAAAIARGLHLRNGAGNASFAWEDTWVKNMAANWNVFNKDATKIILLVPINKFLEEF